MKSFKQSDSPLMILYRRLSKYLSKPKDYSKGSKDMITIYEKPNPFDEYCFISSDEED